MGARRIWGDPLRGWGLASLGMLFLCAGALPGSAGAQQVDPATLPVVEITGPSVIAFWRVPESDSVLVSEPLLAMALDDHQYYWAGTRDLLAELGVAALDQPGRSFRVRDGGGERVFIAEPDSAAVGYLLVGPGTDFFALYRVQYPEELVVAARSFFGIGG